MEMFAEIEIKKSVLPLSAFSACGSRSIKSDLEREMIAQHSLCRRMFGEQSLSSWS